MKKSRPHEGSTPSTTPEPDDIKDDALTKITSFAAPSSDDIAAFEAMTPDEQKAVIFSELEKGGNVTLDIPSHII